MADICSQATKSPTSLIHDKQMAFVHLILLSHKSKPRGTLSENGCDIQYLLVSLLLSDLKKQGKTMLVINPRMNIRYEHNTAMITATSQLF